MKSADSRGPDRTPSQGELERQLIEAGIIASPASAGMYANADPIAFGTSTKGNPEEKSTPSEAEPSQEFARLTDPEHDAIRRQWRKDIYELLTNIPAGHESAAKSARTDRKSAAIQVRSFDC